MKKFEAPSVECIRICAEEITSSTGGAQGGVGNETYTSDYDPLG